MRRFSSSALGCAARASRHADVFIDRVFRSSSGPWFVSPAPLAVAARRSGDAVWLMRLFSMSMARGSVDGAGGHRRPPPGGNQLRGCARCGVADRRAAVDLECGAAGARRPVERRARRAVVGPRCSCASRVSSRRRFRRRSPKLAVRVGDGDGVAVDRGVVDRDRAVVANVDAPAVREHVDPAREQAREAGGVVLTTLFLIVSSRRPGREMPPPIAKRPFGITTVERVTGDR